MPATVEKMTHLPLAVVRYYGRVTVEDTRAVFSQIAGLVDQYGAPLYRMTCVYSETTETTFDEVMMMTTYSSRGTRGSATDPDVITVLVGDSPLLDLFAEAMRQEPFGAVDIPIFDIETDAIAFIQSQIDGDEAGV